MPVAHIQILESTTFPTMYITEHLKFFNADIKHKILFAAAYNTKKTMRCTFGTIGIKPGSSKLTKKAELEKTVSKNILKILVNLQ